MCVCGKGGRGQEVSEGGGCPETDCQEEQKGGGGVVSQDGGERERGQDEGTPAETQATLS